MSGLLVTMTQCPCCDCPVQMSKHTVEECRYNLKQELADCSQWLSDPDTTALCLQMQRERDEARALLSQVGFLVSEAMKRIENEDVPAAYASLKSAIEQIDERSKEKTDAREGD